MRSIEAIKKAIKEIDEKVSGSCPNDPFYYACEPDAVAEALEWVLEKRDTIRIETDKGEFFIGRDGTVKVELYFTTTD